MLLLLKLLNNWRFFYKELEGLMKAKNATSLKIAAGEVRVQDMASEIFIIEQRLLDLKVKKDKPDKAIGKLRLDIIKVESKLSKK